MLSRDVSAIRARVERNDARDLRVFVHERSFWRLAWPPVLVLATLLNIYFAGRYMGVIAPPDDGAPVAFGLNWSELINWATAVVLIVSGRVLMVLLSDNGIGGFEGWRVRTFMRVMLVCLVVFSVYTAAQGVAVGLQQTMDRGAAQSSAYADAGAVVDVEQTGLAGAESALAGAMATAEAARADWARYQQWAQGKDPWLLNATHSQGPARPYIAAVQAADRAVDAARAAVTQSRGRVSDAMRARVDAQASGGAERTQLEQVGASIPAWLGGPWSAEYTAWAFGLFCAVLLEFVCYAGQAGSAATLKSLMKAHEDARGDYAEKMKQEVREAVRRAGQSPAPQAAPVAHHAPEQGPWGPRPVDGAGQQSAPSAGPYQGPSMAAVAAPDPVRASAPLAPLAAHARHADRVADALADARNGMLDSASYPALRARYGGGQEAADLIRDALKREGFAVPSAGGQLQIVGGAA